MKAVALVARSKLISTETGSHSQLWDHADLNTEIKVHLEFRFNLRSVLLDFQWFTEKSVFECAFAHPIMFFIIFG